MHAFQSLRPPTSLTSGPRLERPWLSDFGPVLALWLPLVFVACPGEPTRDAPSVRPSASDLSVDDPMVAGAVLLQQIVPVGYSARGFTPSHVGAGTPGEVVELPGGHGWIGSTEAEIDQRVEWYERYVEAAVGPASRARYEDEVRRPVQVSPLGMDRFEVTTSAFRRFVQATGYGADPRAIEAAHAPRLPVTWVDLADASAYCAWVGGRLPTAVEWEFAARGTAPRRFPWGDTPPDGTRGNFCDLRCPEAWATPDHDDGWAARAPVGSFPAGVTPRGLEDLSGNVREWTASAASDGQAMVKGGGYRNAYDDMISADVRANPWSTRVPDIGFRCVYPAGEPSP